MKKILAGLLSAVVLVAFSAYAEKPEGKVKGEKKEMKAGGGKEAVEELTLTGKISKQGAEQKNAEGKPGKGVKYTLTTEDGTAVQLPRVGKDSTIEMDKYLDKDVTVVGEGKQMEKGGKKTIHLRSIKSVEEVKVEAK